jgi:hypothetical protein
MSDWRRDLRLKLEALIDELVVDGAKQSEVYAAIQAEIEALRLAYDKDPDPADDASDVPCAGMRKTVRTAQDAAETLLQDWPHH